MCHQVPLCTATQDGTVPEPPSPEYPMQSMESEGTEKFHIGLKRPRRIEVPEAFKTMSGGRMLPMPLRRPAAAAIGKYDIYI